MTCFIKCPYCGAMGREPDRSKNFEKYAAKDHYICSVCDSIYPKYPMVYGKYASPRDR